LISGQETQDSSGQELPDQHRQAEGAQASHEETSMTFARPTRDQAAIETARYAVREFSTFDSWQGHQNELAREWLRDPNFVCALDHAIEGVLSRIRYNRQMQSIAAQYGLGAQGVARVVGMVVGEWATGNTTLDRELDSF
jgi:hypothetical protein